MAEEKKFEQSLKELEDIVNKLEEGDIPLEEALDKFQEGVGLSRQLKERLKDAEKTLAKIVTEDGKEELFEQED